MIGSPLPALPSLEQMDRSASMGGDADLAGDGARGHALRV